MVTSFEKYGEWWLPEEPDTKYPGVLVSDSEEDFELRLIGSFHDRNVFYDRLFNNGKNCCSEVILGETEDGNEYTLYDSQLANCTPMTQIYSPSIVLEGKHFSRTDEMVFHSMTMCCSHLGEWLQVSGKKVKHESRGLGMPPKITAEYLLPEPVTIPYDKGHISIGLDGHVKESRFDGDFVVSENVCISVVPHLPVHMTEFLKECLPPVMHFFTLGTGQSLSIIELRGKASADCQNRLEEEIKFAPKIRLYRRGVHFEKPDEKIHWFEMIFTYPNIKPDFEKCFSLWVSLYRDIEHVMQLFFEKVITRKVFSSNSFLNSVQAAEAYHRFRRDGIDLPEREHQSRINSIIDASPPEYRGWLKMKLHFSNEVIFRKRIEELLTERKNLFEFSLQDVETHVKHITEIRNYFTHYSKKERPKSATGRNFVVYDLLMMWTVIACFLEDMGIERTKAHDLIRNCNAFWRFKRLCERSKLDVERVP